MHDLNVEVAFPPAAAPSGLEEWRGKEARKKAMKNSIYGQLGKGMRSMTGMTGPVCAVAVTGAPRQAAMSDTWH